MNRQYQIGDEVVAMSGDHAWERGTVDGYTNHRQYVVKFPGGETRKYPAGDLMSDKEEVTA